MSALELPAHLRPYARLCPPDLSTFLRDSCPDGDELRIAGLVCPCGEPALLVGVAFNWEVVDAACGSCGHEFPLYDPKVHGWLGARGRNDYPRPPFEATPYGCMCRMMRFQLAVALRYRQPADAPEAFTFLAVAGRCVACGMANLVLDAEAD